MTRIVLFLAAALASTAFAYETPSREALPAAAPPKVFRAPGQPVTDAVSMGPNLHKATGAPLYPGGPQWVATVRDVASPYRVSGWRAIEGGFVARFRAYAEGAQGLRVRLDLGTTPGAMEMRAAGDDGRVFTMALDPTLGPQAWGPWTDGPSQVVEVFSPVRPSADALTMGALLNFDVSPLTKAASSCTVSTLCTTANAATDTAILEAKRSIMRISGVIGSSGFFCSATLINTPKFPAAYVLTANHCVSTAATAASLTTRWLWETTSCAVADASPQFEQVAGGMQLVYTNFHVDTTLLLMNAPPPAGAVHIGLYTARLQAPANVVSLSHPAGDAARQALGSVTGEIRAATEEKGPFPQDMYRVIWTTGATEGGSSGSGLFAMSGSSLRLAGVLFGGSLGDTCTTTRDAIYGRMEIFAPEIDPYISLASVPADDAPNRAIDLINAPLDPVADLALNLRTTPMVHASKQIGIAGDMDVYRFVLSQPRTVAAWSEGGVDLVASFLGPTGAGIAANDDAQSSTFDFGITRELPAGTYYLQVAHFDSDGTGSYTAKLQAFDVGQNYTDLWWNALESGWGVNLSHQGTTIFATLYTYDTDGTPMWLVMSNGDRQPDGTFSGPLYRVTGPAFNANPWTPVNATQVGTMTLAFGLPSEGTLTYTVNGVSVTKSITRFTFGTAPECTWSAFDRSFANNVQDLWWNPLESGWGVNLAQQGGTVFATLYTYAPNGKAMWYVMSSGTEQPNGSISGTLYRTTGPAFNASPWTTINTTAVGTMTFTFAFRDEVYEGGGGNRATLTYTVDGVSVTKQIQRYDFANPKTECSR